MSQNNLTTHQQTEVALTPERVDIGLDFLKQRLDSLGRSPEARKECLAAIPYLTQPAQPAELLVRVAALMNPYFEKEQPDAVRDKILEDWHDALKDYPQWAIDRACQWWQGDNPNRRKIPMHGDIAARVRVEMSPVRTAISRISHVKLQERLNGDKEPQGKPISEEQRDDVAETLKTFGIDKDKDK